MINIAYVGFGKSTNRYHLPYLEQRLDRFNVKKIYARHLGKRPADEAHWQARGTVFTDNFNDILEDSALDLVVVVTPAPSHFEMVKTLLEHGKNVLVDKPMTKTLAQAQTLVELAHQKQLFVMPFQNRRFDSDFLTLQKVLSLGYVGRPIDLEVHMDHYRPEDAIMAGDTINGDWYGHGVHLVDQMVKLFGRPKQVSYDVRATRELSATIDDHFEAQLFYDNAFKATVQATESAAVAYPKWILQGTKGTYIKYNVDQQEYDLKSGLLPGDADFGIDAPQDYGKVIYYNQNHDRIEKVIPSQTGDYGRVYDAVYETIVNQAEKLVTDAQMLAVIEILEQGLPLNQPHLTDFEK